MGWLDAGTDGPADYLECDSPSAASLPAKLQRPTGTAHAPETVGGSFVCVRPFSVRLGRNGGSGDDGSGTAQWRCQYPNPRPHPLPPKQSTGGDRGHPPQLE